MTYKPRLDLSVNNEGCESLALEIVNKDTKNTVMNIAYRPPAGNTKDFKNHLKNSIQKNSEKPVYHVGDYNLNALLYSSNNKVRHSLINKPTRVTMDEATA